MRIQRREKKNKKQKTKIESKNKIYNPWRVRSKKYSEYPYVVTISVVKKNVYFSATDLRGRIKYWINAGRAGFKTKEKTRPLALFTTTEKFFKKLLRYGIHDIFIRFKNYKGRTYQIQKALRKLKLARRSRLKGKVKKFKNWNRKHQKRQRRRLRVLGIWTDLHISFNGCCPKKKRRKRTRRHPARIRIR